MGQAVAQVSFKNRCPHCYLLLALYDQAKVHAPEAISTAINAEINDPQKLPLLQETVSKVMTDDHFGPYNPHTWCMVNDYYWKGFPFLLCQHFSIDVQGLPHYQAETLAGQYQNVSQIMLFFNWTTPGLCHTNPTTSRNANVTLIFGYAGSIHSVKYLYKYVHKGNNRCDVMLRKQFDHNKITLHYKSCIRQQLVPCCSWSLNHFHNILRLFDVLLTFLLTTSETMRDYYL